jgi:hypothetical protein
MTHARIAYLSCQETLPGSPTRRPDAFEHDLVVTSLQPALLEHGRVLESVAWDSPDTHWSDYESAVIGTTWDYHQRLPHFLQTLEHIESKTPLLNPSKVVQWNSRKTYLRALSTQGIATVPTHWVDSVNETNCRAAFEAFGVDTLVLKPQVGAGAWRQVRWQRAEPFPSTNQIPPGSAMVQPFLQSVATVGEYSFLFFDRVFSHAVLKKAAQGDYRVQSTYGGVDTAIQPTTHQLDIAQSVVDAVKGPLLYARVDMVENDENQLLLMELELIEPYLYPSHAAQMGARFASAYLRLLSSFR